MMVETVLQLMENWTRKFVTWFNPRLGLASSHTMKPFVSVVTLWNSNIVGSSLALLVIPSAQYTRIIPRSKTEVSA
jgi:hypothetical protein